MKASSLEVIDDISDKDRGEIHRQMYSEVLEVERYPDITYDCSRVTITGTGATFSATLNGDLTLHGETRALEVPVRVSMTGSILKASGQFSVSQRTFGIAPVSVAGGAIKLKDEIKCTFNIAARKQE
jgi:polyisoprenoid-binding protein YceI